MHALDLQGAQVVLDAGLQLGGGVRRQPAPGVVAPRADLGDEREVVRVRVQRLPDQVVDDLRPVVLRRVDVVDAEFEARRRTAIAASRSRGGPNTPGPASCIAPKPIRRTRLLPSSVSRIAVDRTT